MELVKIKKTYVSKKDGKEKSTWNLYLYLPNGDYVAIKPTYDKDTRGYYTLLACARVVIPDDSKLPF